MTTAETTDSTIVFVSRLIKASREDVFRAWTEPDEISKWFGPEGSTVTHAEAEASEGGNYRIRVESQERDPHTAIGTYQEVDPVSRLVFTWNWEEEEFRMGEDTLVTVELLDQGEATEVRITHKQFPNAEAKIGHEEGWKSSLNCLEQLFQ